MNTPSNAVVAVEFTEMQVHQSEGDWVGDIVGARVGSLLWGVGSRVVGNFVGLGLGIIEGLDEG